MLLLLASFVILALGQQDSSNSVMDPTNRSFATGQSTSEAPEAQGSPTPFPESTAVVAWDRSNNTGTAVTLSATFTDAPGMNSDLADDFDVQDYAWIVRWIDVDAASYSMGRDLPIVSQSPFMLTTMGFLATKSMSVPRGGSRMVAHSGYIYATTPLLASRSYIPAGIGSRSKPT